MKQNRLKTIAVRVNEPEYDEIKMKADKEGTPVAAYLRRLGVSQPDVPRYQTELLIQLDRAIGCRDVETLNMIAFSCANALKDIKNGDFDGKYRESNELLKQFGIER